jgi:hypothetical protein
LKRRAFIVQDQDVQRCIESESIASLDETKSFYSGDFSVRSGKCSPVIKKISPRIKLLTMMAKRAREMALAAAQNEEPPIDDGVDKPLMHRVTFKF